MLDEEGTLALWETLVTLSANLMVCVYLLAVRTGWVGLEVTDVESFLGLFPCFLIFRGDRLCGWQDVSTHQPCLCRLP